MASRLTSLRPEIEYGGVSVNGCYGKVRSNTVQQGDVWIHGLFCEDEFLTRNLNPSTVSCQTAAESSTNEHLEVDWIAKEIAFQDLICNDRSSHWLDAYPEKSELVKEEQEVDIISTLTAVAALFRDWCTDLSEPLVTSSLEAFSSLKGDNQDEGVFIRDCNIKVNKPLNKPPNLPLQNEMLKWSNYELTWDEFFKERLKSQHMSHDTFVPQTSDAQGSMYGIKSCEHRRVEEAWQGSQHSIQHKGGTSHCLGACKEDCIKRASLLADHEELGNGMGYFDEMGAPDHHCVMFGSHSPASSRYSFCQQGDTSNMGEIFQTEDLVHDELFAARLYSAQETFNATWFTPIAGDELQPIMAEDVVVGGLTFEEDLLLNDGVSSVVDLRKKAPVSPEALLFALSYLSLQDLLTMERVCKFLRHWIRNDVLLWQKLNVEPPLSKSLTDEVLLELASRSKGQLQCLSLLECTKVTEAAVEQVVAANPRLTKLFLPGCSKISADSVVKMVDMLTNHSHGKFPGLKQLRVRNIYGLTREHLASLENMVGVRAPHQTSSRKPQYYHSGHEGSSCDDDRPIDVEECPKCMNVRLVYDCTRERCQQKPGLECRACFLCTVRCEECGRCISNSDYKETFSLDLLCLCCWLRLPKCTKCSRPGSGGSGRHADHFTRVLHTILFQDGDGHGES